MRKVKIGKRTAVVAVLMAVLCVGVAYGALLSYYGQITTTVTVEQSVLVDGQTWNNPIVETFTVTGGSIIYTPHWVESKAKDLPVDITFVPTVEPNDGGVEVTYLKPAGYSVEVTTFEVSSIPDQYYSANIKVEDIGSALKWTFDMIGDKQLEGDGHWGIALVISFDGSTPEFQVHNNDGTCGAFPDGTWLCSPYDKTGGGWYGWHTSEADWNTEVDSLDWVDATGDRYYTNNPTGTFTITINKEALPAEKFSWAVWVGVGGFYSPNNGYSSYPGGFDWTNNAFAEASILEPLTLPLTLAPGQRVDFVIRYLFVPAAYGDYTITTTVAPS